MKAKPIYSLPILAAVTFSIGALVGRKTAPESPADPQEQDGYAANTRRPVERTSSGSSGSRVGLFKTIRADDFQALSQSALDSPDVLESEALLPVLISEWAKKNPYAALSYAAGIQDRDDLVQEALRQLAQTQPDGALEWIKENASDSNQRHSLLQAAFNGMAKADPEGTVARVELLPAGSQRDQLLSMTINEWAAKDINAAVDWMEDTELTPQFANIYNEVMGHYINQDPAKAAELISQMKSGENKLNLAPQMATKLAETDPGAALTWAQTLDGDEKNYALLGVMDRWASGDDGEDALRHVLEDSSQPNHEELFSMVAMKLAHTDPEKLTGSFESMGEAEQVIAARQLATAYSQNDQEQGIDWMQSLPAGAVKDEALKTTISTYQYSKVDQAFGLSETISNPRSRARQMREVLTTWASVNQTAAEQALNDSTAVSSNEKQRLLTQLRSNLKFDDYVLPAKQ